MHIPNDREKCRWSRFIRHGFFQDSRESELTDFHRRDGLRDGHIDNGEDDEEHAEEADRRELLLELW